MEMKMGRLQYNQQISIEVIQELARQGGEYCPVETVEITNVIYTEQNMSSRIKQIKSSKYFIFCRRKEERISDSGFHCSGGANARAEKKENLGNVEYEAKLLSERFRLS